ncbi:MAG: hypothetical protein KKB62_02970, partial [Nanoarchaeota archaeon]|nr:hypothetical protein [Nanoarchaeota archaeon]
RGGETFQFPLAINIEGNVARKIGSGNSVPETSIDLCTEGSESTVTVNLVDSSGNAVEGDVSYECFSSKCQIGGTQNGVITGSFPQCVNGKVIVQSGGYRKVSHIFSTVEGGSTTIVMDKIYTKNVLVNLRNSRGDEKAIISFNSESSDESHTISYPEQNQISLGQGAYTIQLYVYDESELTFEATTTQQCVEVPSGIGGLIGLTHKECTSINIPKQTISNVLVAGGSAQAFLSEADLAGNNRIRISVDRYNTPSSLQELQIVYTLVDSKNLEVVFI